MADGTHGFNTDTDLQADIAELSRTVYPKIESKVSLLEWQLHAPLIAKINRLKRQKNAVILAHNYMTPEIFHGVGDIVGDSLALAREAANTDAQIIVQAGVHFMAETAKILSPDKTVLIPDLEAGCSLASSITGADVRAIKAAYPGVPIVTYVNTSADVKAESDICCTSANAVEVVESLGVDQVIMIPDQYLARNVAAQTDVKVMTWAGSCEVHEQFTAQDIHDMKSSFPDAVVVAHPECPPEVLKAADFAGSTGAMIDYVTQEQPAKVVLVTECSMADNIAHASPTSEFLRPCNLCPHMKRISLENILRALESETHAVEVAPEVAEKARVAIQRMLDLKKNTGKPGYNMERAHMIDPDIPVISRQSLANAEPRRHG